MRYRFQVQGKIYNITLERSQAGLQAIIDGLPFELEVLDQQPGSLSLLFEGRPVILHWAADGNQKWISLDGCSYQVEKPTPRSRQAAEGAAGGSVHAPMPAQVRSVDVFEGELVEKGRTLVLLEAMKMEIRIQAPQPGRVARLLVQTGQTVERDQVLVELEEA